MKSHYYACETRDITFGSVGHTAGEGAMPPTHDPTVLVRPMPRVAAHPDDTLPVAFATYVDTVPLAIPLAARPPKPGHTCSKDYACDRLDRHPGRCNRRLGWASVQLRLPTLPPDVVAAAMRTRDPQRDRGTGSLTPPPPPSGRNSAPPALRVPSVRTALEVCTPEA